MAEELDLLGQRLSRLDGQPMRSSSAPSRTGSLWSGGVQAVWELDIWGRYRNATAAAREHLLSAEETQQALELSVAGQVCSAYFDLLNYDAQRELTRRTLATREDSAALYEKQYAAGTINELDILNVRTQVDTLKDSLAQAGTRVEQAEAALHLLTGASPREIFEEGRAEAVRWRPSRPHRSYLPGCRRLCCCADPTFRLPRRLCVPHIFMWVRQGRLSSPVSV